MYIYNTIFIVLGVIGFSLAFHIYKKKRAGGPLICPLKSNCDTVITSKYSKVFGIPIEILGMIYYLFVAVVHAIFSIIPGIVTPTLFFVSVFVSAFAFCFSIYLTLVQAFALKEWCTWCLFSAFLCLLILITVILSAPLSVFVLFSMQ